MTEQQTVKTGNVTLDDVRVALGDTSPHSTNAGKIREILGRGSFQTIQKFLDTIRAEHLAAAQPQTSTTVPTAPAAEMAAIWASAWNAAQVQTLVRLEKLNAERDSLTVKNADLATDLDDLTARLDALDAQTQEANALAQTAQDKMAALAEALTAAHAATAKATEDAAHAAALAQKDAALAQREAEIKLQAHQSTIDRMTEQLSEIKALHIVAATAHPAPTTKEKK